MERERLGRHTSAESAAMQSFRPFPLDLNSQTPILDLFPGMPSRDFEPPPFGREPFSGISVDTKEKP